MCVFVHSVYVYICVADFEGICIFMQHNKKQERDASWWRTLTGKICGRVKKGHKNKVIIISCANVGEVNSFFRQDNSDPEEEELYCKLN